MCVDVTGLGPTLEPFVFSGFVTSFPHFPRYLNFDVPFLVVYYFFERSNYKVLLQFN